MSWPTAATRLRVNKRSVAKRYMGGVAPTAGGKSPAVAVLYINGLGTEGAFLSRLQKHWQKAGVDFIAGKIIWYDGESLADKLAQLDRQIAKLLPTHEKLILLGSSAGA